MCVQKSVCVNNILKLDSMTLSEKGENLACETNKYTQEMCP